MPPKKTAQKSYVFATSTVAIREPGAKFPTSVTAGSVWYADCPLVLAYPHMFSDEPPVVHPRGWEPPVEQMTAAPGEHRDSGRE